MANILVTGTPGTGKTTLAAEVAQATGWEHINIGERVKAEELHHGWDEDFEAWTLDEDKVCDALEDRMVQGGCIVDHHTCDFFPERWFHLVIVLTTDNTILYERLEKRGYSAKKLQENIECEIMMVVQEDAIESYRRELVQILPSNTTDDMDSNTQKIVSWIQQQQ